MSACKRGQIMTSLETLIFLGLCVLAIVLTWEEIAKYRSGDSSFKRSKGKIAKLPIITICFSPKSVTLEYGKHFNISKYKSYPESTNDNSRQNILNIGKNFKEQVILSLIKTGFSGQCFQIQSTVTDVNKELYELISVNLQENITENLSLKFFFTSENNKKGIFLNYWMEGDVIEIKVKPNTFNEIGLREEEFRYLDDKSKSNCTHDDKPFYDCFIEELKRDDFSGCNPKCLPFTIGENSLNQNLSSCHVGLDGFANCAEYSFNLLLNVSSQGKCLRPCQINEYSAITTDEDTEDQKIAILAYYFLPPHSKVIQEEYFIYDICVLFSSIGGTLGLCIGFSLRGEVKYFQY